MMFSFVAAALFGALDLLGVLQLMNADQIAPSIVLRILMLGFIIIFGLLAWWHISQQNTVLMSKTPRIVLKGIVVRKGPLRQSTPYSLRTREQYEAYFVDVQFANVPEYGTEQNHANGISASLTYYGADGNILIECGGRWASTTEQVRQAMSQGQDLARIQIKSDGISETTTAAFKPIGSARWFVFNNDSYLRGFKDSSLELTEPTVDVHIELVGERVRRDFWLRLLNEGENGGIFAEEHKPWAARKLSRNRRRNQSSRKFLQRRNS